MMSELTISTHEHIHGTRPVTASRTGKLNVVHVPRRFVENEWGGTETAILETSRALNSRGHSSSIMTTTMMCGRRYEKIRDVDVHRHQYVYPFWGLSRQAKRDMDRKGGNLLSFPLFRALLGASGADILHAHSGKRLGGIVRTAARMRKIPYVISLHGGLIDVPGDEMKEMLEPLRGAFEWGRAFGAALGARRVLDDASAILCVGRNEQKAVQARYPDKRVEWLPNGVDAKRFASGNGRAFLAKNGIPRNRKLILNVGRIDPQKNQLALLSAMPDLIRKHRDVHLALIGPVTVESYGMKLLNRVHEASLYDHVTIIPGLPGGSSELVDAYHAADVFCLPSRHEPFGIVVLEAWASGLPVIASRVGGIPSFTEDGVDVLFADASEPGSFGASIDRLLGDPELAMRIGGNGRNKACTQFDWFQVTGRLETIYRELVGN
jgi:glycosyltransferase involved in cell wall biosynthesis